MIPISAIENLLGYLELDLENRELENKSDWEETYRVVKEWLDTQRSPTPREAVAPKQGVGLTLELVHMANSLGNMLIDASSKGYVSGNDLDFANDCLDRVIPLLPPTP